MAPVLIAYASTEGHGETIARRLKKAIELHGREAFMLDVKGDIDGVNAVMIGPEAADAEAAAAAAAEARGPAADDTAVGPATDDRSQSREADWLDWSAAIVVGSIHFGDYDTELFGFSKRFGGLLSSKPSAFLSVSLSAASDDMESRMAVEVTAQTLLMESGWLPSKLLHVAGAVKEKELNFFKRGALQAVLRAKGIAPDPSGVTVFTDWQALDKFVDEFIALIDKAAVPDS